MLKFDDNLSQMPDHSEKMPFLKRLAIPNRKQFSLAGAFEHLGAEHLGAEHLGAQFGPGVPKTWNEDARE